jgi:hypothetical protein
MFGQGRLRREDRGRRSEVRGQRSEIMHSSLLTSDL